MTVTLLDLHRWCLMARRIEERLGALYRRGAVAGGVYLGKGQEALSAALAMHLHPGQDLYAPAIRDMAGRLAFGESALNVFRVYLGRRTGTMRGRDGNIHRGDLSRGYLPMISHLGSFVSVVNGALLARRLAGRKAGSVGAVVLGDGAMACGATHEGLNMAGVERLPLVAVVANNRIAYSTTNDRSFACSSLALRGPAYGMQVHEVDGEDPSACLQVLGEAVARARSGAGPQMVVATLLRLCGHGEHDDASYMPPELLAQATDCLQNSRCQLLASGAIDEAGLAALDEQIQAHLAEAQREAEGDPEPDPVREDWHSYSERWLTQGLVP